MTLSLQPRRARLHSVSRARGTGAGTPCEGIAARNKVFSDARRAIEKVPTIALPEYPLSHQGMVEQPVFDT